MNIKKKMTDAQRIEFAKQVEQLYDVSQPGWRKMILAALAKGVATGFGIFVGGTIVVTLLLWILSGLGQVPFLHDISQSTQETIDSSTRP